MRSRPPFILAFLLFPEGHPQRALEPALAPYMNPLFTGLPRTIGDIAFGIVVVLMVLMFVLSAISIMLRLHRARGAERQQLKWVAHSIVLAAVALPTSVLVVGLVLPIVAGDEDAPAVFVATVTLLLAAVLRPVHNRIQSMVDRRFNRRRYDASTITEGFATRLRDELEIDALRSELVPTVGDAMEPVHVSVWLRRTTASPSPRRGLAFGVDRPIRKSRD